METATLTLSALDDSPISAPAPSMHAQQQLDLSEAVSRLMAHADADGFAIVGYDAVLDAVAQATRHSVQFLLDNPWMVKSRLDAIGVNTAPDFSLERRKLKPADSIVLYRADHAVPPVRRRPYKKGLTLVKFLTLAFQPLSQPEMTLAKAMIEQWTPNQLYSRHLCGMLRWYDQRRRLLDRRTVRAFDEIMSHSDRELMAAQLIDFAAQRGLALSPRSVMQLDRLLAMCGHQPGQVHALLHRRQATAATVTAGAIEPSGTAALDMRLLGDIEHSTSVVRDMLADVFESTDEAPAAEATSQGVGALVDALMQRDEWSTAEAEELVARLMPGTTLSVALERINDLAMEAVADTIADQEGDAIYMATCYRDQMESRCKALA